MGSSWGLVILLWGSLIGGIVIFFISDYRKSTEQRKEEASKSRQRREEDIRKQQAKKEQMPAKGCLQSTLELWFACLVLFIVVIICIMALISTTM